MDRFHRAATALALDDQPTEALPMLAAQALADGIDTPALAELAACSRHDVPADLRDLFLQALHELSVPVPDRETAGLRRMNGTAEALLNGTRPPYEATYDLYWSACALPPSPARTKLITDLVWLWSSWEDRPADRPSIEQDMRRAAEEWLATDSGRMCP
ncbi:hypothetical protein SRB5_57710 [Streptomyces sp. RB5]|uniref:Uncharacterized protein n=1 Tax=Streptomyces smaragdinus TaxID=2585196 RepID=A0A7K0CQ43_9ACTN|nr:hypothetical protein [Streptomyces smaragdinus]MQY15587.1 hypothetical protein [Streptomyces smaragdinus]